MAKRFVISTDPITAEQEKALKDYFAGRGWWHWLPNFWLIKDSSESLSTAEIRSEFAKIAPNARCIVIEVEHKGWAARTRPDSKGRDMAEWINGTWTKEP